MHFGRSDGGFCNTSELIELIAECGVGIGSSTPRIGVALDNDAGNGFMQIGRDAALPANGEKGSGGHYRGSGPLETKCASGMFEGEYLVRRVACTIGWKPELSL